MCDSEWAGREPDVRFGSEADIRTAEAGLPRGMSGIGQERTFLDASVDPPGPESTSVSATLDHLPGVLLPDKIHHEETAVVIPATGPSLHHRYRAATGGMYCRPAHSDQAQFLRWWGRFASGLERTQLGIWKDADTLNARIQVVGALQCKSVEQALEFERDRAIRAVNQFAFASSDQELELVARFWQVERA